jgi:hypothetical protein
MKFTAPRPLEYPEHYRPGMGTENVGPFLRSIAQMTRPSRMLEVGAGYTTPFLLEALINNQRIFNDGNLKETCVFNYNYAPKLVVIDDMSLGELSKRKGMNDIINSNYVDFVEGQFQGRAKKLYEKYGAFDFVWFDCGGAEEYESFFSEYWDICSYYIFCHFTYSDGVPNANLQSILKGVKDDPFIIDIIEPHKTRQGSITIIKKRNP